MTEGTPFKEEQKPQEQQTQEQQTMEQSQQLVQQPPTQQPLPQQLPVENKRVLAGVFGIIMGGFGVHKFILGYTTEGILQILLTVITCGVGGILGQIEGIIYLTKTDDDFYKTYQANKKGWL